MKRTLFRVRPFRLTLLGIAFSMLACAGARADMAGNRSAEAKRLQPISVPLMFEENAGQAPEGLYLARLPGYEAKFSSAGVVFELQGQKRNNRLEMSFLGAATQVRLEASDRLLTRTNYYLGNDPAKWRVGLQNYAKLTAAEIYPGINLVFHGNHAELEHDFVVAPFADPAVIALKLTGEKKLRLEGNGDLLAITDAGKFRLRKPQVYQEIAGIRKTVDAGFRLSKGNIIRFDLARYDRRYPLVIDPVLVFATYVGGSPGATGNALVLDDADNIYLTGGNGNQAFVARFNGNSRQDDNGSRLAWMTLLGGAGTSDTTSIAASEGSAPQIYVMGFTFNPATFPITANLAFQATSSAPSASFAARLDGATGSLNYSTFLSGSGFETAAGIAVDGLGLIYVAGNTNKKDMLTTPGAFDNGTLASDGQVGYALKFDPAVKGSGALQYGTFITCKGGQGMTIEAIVVKEVIPAGKPPQIFLAGTDSGTSCLASAGTNSKDAFVVRINPAGSGGSDLVFVTQSGGSGDDFGNALAVDSNGNPTVVGSTNSPEFTFQHDGIQHALLATFKANGQLSQVQSTAESQGTDTARAAAINTSTGEIFIAGVTTGNNIKNPDGGFPKPSKAGTSSGFLLSLESSRNTFDVNNGTFATYFGGSSNDGINGVALNSDGIPVVIGTFTSTDAATSASAFEIKPMAAVAAYVAKYAASCDTTELTVKAADGSPDPATVGFSSSFASTLTNTWTITDTGADAKSVVFNSPMPMAGGGPALDAATYSATVMGVAGACTTNTGGVTCVIPTLRGGTPGDLATVQVSAKVTGNINSAETLSVNAGVLDAGAQNDSACLNSGGARLNAIQTSAVATPAFVPGISAQPINGRNEVGVGDQVSFPITVANTGGVRLTSLTLSVNLNLLKGFVLGSVSAGSNTATCDLQGGSGCSNIPLIPVGSSFTYTLTGHFASLDTDPVTGLAFNSEDRSIPANLGIVNGSGTGAFALAEVNTHLGTNVEVIPDEPRLPDGREALSVTFGQVNAVGTTSLRIGTVSPNAVVNYQAGGSGGAIQYNLVTTADIGGTTTICVNTPDPVGYVKPSRARIFWLNNPGGPLDVTSAATPSGATEILPTSFNSNLANPTVLISVCGQGNFPPGTLSFAVLEPVNHPPFFNPLTTVTPVSTSKGGSAGQSSVQLTVSGEKDGDTDVCVLGGNPKASCSDQPNLKTYIFGSFISSTLPGANCFSGCTFLDLSNSSNPNVTVEMGNNQQLCVVALDQTVNPNQSEIISGILNGNCPPLDSTNSPIFSPLSGIFIQSIQIVPSAGSPDGAGPNSATITAGQVAITNIAFMANPPATPVPALTCSPAGSTPNLASVGISCALGQTVAISPAGTPTIQLMVQTTARSLAGAVPPPTWPDRLPAIPIAAMVLLGTLLSRRKQLMSRRLALGMAAMVLFALLVGCGGGFGGGSGQAVAATPSGTYTIVVTSNGNVLFDPGDGSNKPSLTTYTFTLNVK